MNKTHPFLPPSTSSLGVAMVFAAALFSAALNLHAMPASPEGFFEEQPDGKRVRLYLRGDEFYHWLEDPAGFTVVENRGWFVYAQRDPASGELRPTSLRAGRDDPGAAGLSRRELPSPALRGARRAAMQADGQAGEGGPAAVPAVQGSLRNLVVLMRFSNHATRAVPTQANIDVLMNAIGGHPSLAPTGSVRDAYFENSYGALSLDSTVAYWVTLPNTESYYANNQSGLTTRTHLALRSALDALDADPNFDFTDFDEDQDGAIDAITFLHSGYGAEWGGTSADGAPYRRRIWSHKWTISGGGWLSSDGVRVTDYHISPAIWGTSGTNIGHIGVICHETGHFLGLPDLYDGSGGQGIGSYCLMANSWGFDGTQYYPPHMSAWCKAQLGWVEPTVITLGGLYDIEQAETVSQAYRVDLSYPSGEYLLIENRQPTGLDGAMPQGGLAIFHIDETASYTTEGYPGQAGWPQNGNHYRVALLQADGLYELERGLNRGNAGDVYRGGGVADLGPETVPNTDAYQGGNVYPTDNRIFDISAAGSVMTFRFEVTSNLPPVSVPTAAPDSGETPLQVSFDGSSSFDPDGSLIAYVWDFGDGEGDSGVSTNHTYSQPGYYTASLTVTDNLGSTHTATLDIQVVEPPPPLPFETGIITGLGSLWATIPLVGTYDSPVIIATPSLPNRNLPPAVARIRNVDGDSFQIRLQNPAGLNIPGYPVHFLVVEEGVYTQAEHGVNLEAVRVQSIATSNYTTGWLRESRSYQNAYVNPVVTGQVMTENDPRWSAFWSRGPTRADPPTASWLDASKHTGEDPAGARSAETLGMVIAEQGSWTVDGVQLSAFLGADTIRGTANSTVGYPYSVPGIASAQLAVLSIAGTDSTEGGWPVLFGLTPVANSEIRVAIEEDDVGDAERSHTTEQAACLVFDQITRVLHAPLASFSTQSETIAAPVDMTFDASGSSDADGQILSYAWDFGDGNSAQGVAAQHTFALPGAYQVVLTVMDDTGIPSLTSRTITVVAPAPLTDFFETGVVSDVTDAWEPVALQNTYTSPVVIATVHLPDRTLPPAVARVRNASSNGFELRLQNPSGLPVPGYAVHYLVVEEGVYSPANHGFKMEAVQAASTRTAGSVAGWVREARTFRNTYLSPVVVGQVMTSQDPAWSVFWANGALRTDPPVNGDMDAGKHVGQDPNAARLNETIGYIILETGTGSMDGTPYRAFVGTDTIRGTADSATGYGYALQDLVAPNVAVASIAGIDSTEGGWPVLFGSAPVSSTQVRLAIEEDDAGDAERSHTHEQVACLVFGTASTVLPLLAPEGIDAPESPTNHSAPSIRLVRPLAGAAEATYVVEWTPPPGMSMMDASLERSTDLRIWNPAGGEWRYTPNRTPFGEHSVALLRWERSVHLDQAPAGEFLRIRIRSALPGG